MSTVLHHKDGTVAIKPLKNGDNEITVELTNTSLHMPVGECETSYPIELIELILNITGPAILCDEIIRDEKSEFDQNALKYDILGYIEPESFQGKRLLDFRCGSGSSTIILARMLPDTEIVGIELKEYLLEIAEIRSNFYKVTNTSFMVSPNVDELPADLGEFDYIVLSAVYENFLPQERKTFFPKIWDHLKPDGVLFLNQTPYRYFPVETQTTALFFINYLPDRLAYFYATRCSPRKLRSETWQSLLRRGIRGGTVEEILSQLQSDSFKPILMEPSRFGLKNRIDLWDIKMDRSKYRWFKELFGFFSKAIYFLTDSIYLPHLSLAIRKQPAGK